MQTTTQYRCGRRPLEFQGKRYEPGDLVDAADWPRVESWERMGLLTQHQVALMVAPPKKARGKR